MKKVFAGIAALAVMAVLGSSVSAADWSKATYADENPDTCNILSFDANGITVEEVNDGEITKVAINLSEVLADPADISKVYEGSWKITYTGLSSFTGTEVGWLGGGCYAATGNSAGFSLSPDEYDENGAPIWNDTQTVEDSFKWLLPSSVPASAGEGTFVFMDWSSQPLKSNGVTITFSDLVLKDKDGNEIAQKTADTASAPVEEAPAEEVAEEAPAAEAPAEEAPAVVEAAPAVVETTANTPTGNAPVLAIAAVMALAGTAAALTRRK